MALDVAHPRPGPMRASVYFAIAAALVRAGRIDCTRAGIRAQSGPELALIERLAAWRERKAVELDMAPVLVARNDVLYALASQRPETVEELLSIQGIRASFARLHHREVLQLIRSSSDSLSDGEGPVLRDAAWRTDRHADSRTHLMLTWASTKATIEGIAPFLLYSANEIRQLGHHDDPSHEDVRNLRVLRGWRRGLLGQDLLKIHDGKLGVRWNAQLNRAELMPCE